jgi:hypothetical protein
VDGVEPNTPHYTYVDDTLMVDTGGRIPHAIVASIDSCFTILGTRDDTLRPCPLSDEKFDLLECSPRRRQLGIIIDTNKMIISIPPEKIAKLQHLLQPYHTHRERFNILKMAELLGNLDHIGANLPWFRHVYINIRKTFNHCLRDKLQVFKSSDNYKDLITRINSTPDDDTRSTLTHHLTQLQTKYIYANTQAHEEAYLSPNFKEDLGLITALSSEPSFWFTPIPHIIHRIHPFTAFCDSCEYGAGGFSPELGFIWHLHWPTQQNDDLLDDTTHINIKEFISIIITFALARSHLLHHPALAPDTYPTIIIKSDNTSAISWSTKGIASDNKIAHHFSRILCSLRLNSNLGLHVEHIPGEDNGVSDDISRISLRSHHSPSLSSRFIQEQIDQVKQRHQCIQHCALFPIPSNLHLLISNLLSPRAERLRIRWLNRQGQLTPAWPSSPNGSYLLD